MQNFNPRPRKEGDYAIVDCCNKSGSISIHALVKRATNLPVISSYSLDKISIHALVKRATKVPVEKPDGQEISIHALVKRATAHAFMMLLFLFLFQSTPS